VSADPSCIFCKIAAGEIPSARVLETGHAVAFLDINPVNKGHVLVVPRAHHATLADLPEQAAAQAASLLPRLCRAVRKAARADGLNVIVNVGAVAGQTVDHVHWHIIPRHARDHVHWPWPHEKYAGDEMGRMREEIEKSLASGD
jgi:histidine triad (HIT) family protein